MAPVGLLSGPELESHCIKVKIMNFGQGRYIKEGGRESHLRVFVLWSWGGVPWALGAGRDTGKGGGPLLGVGALARRTAG